MEIVEKSKIRNTEEEIRQTITSFPTSTELETCLANLNKEITYLEEYWNSTGSSVRIEKLKEYVENIRKYIINMIPDIEELKKTEIVETTIYNATYWDWY